MTVVKICLSLHGRSKEIYRCLLISCAKTQQKLNVKYKNCLFVTGKAVSPVISRCIYVNM